MNTYETHFLKIENSAKNRKYKEKLIRNSRTEKYNNLNKILTGQTQWQNGDTR